MFRMEEAVLVTPETREEEISFSETFPFVSGKFILSGFRFTFIIPIIYIEEVKKFVGEKNNE